MLVKFYRGSDLTAEPEEEEDEEEDNMNEMECERFSGYEYVRSYVMYR